MTLFEYDPAGCRRMSKLFLWSALIAVAAVGFIHFQLFLVIEPSLSFRFIYTVAGYSAGLLMALYCLFIAATFLRGLASHKSPAVAIDDQHLIIYSPIYFRARLSDIDDVIVAYPSYTDRFRIAFFNMKSGRTRRVIFEGIAAPSLMEFEETIRSHIRRPSPADA